VNRFYHRCHRFFRIKKKIHQDNFHLVENAYDKPYMAESINHQVALFKIYFHNNRHLGNVSKGISGDWG
tara:strand:+ start:245 stop:451 length:207 start_codon:yes stop_codon:yes gene_type:complete